LTEKGKYATGSALRAALEERLRQIAKAEGMELQRLRRQVAFDRLLARLFDSGDTPWVRISQARVVVKEVETDAMMA
jgi:hypothetical protein